MLPSFVWVISCQRNKSPYFKALNTTRNVKQIQNLSHHYLNNRNIWLLTFVLWNQQHRILLHKKDSVRETYKQMVSKVSSIDSTTIRNILTKLQIPKNFTNQFQNHLQIRSAHEETTLNAIYQKIIPRIHQSKAKLET